jgi:hypothetical protein
VSNPVYFVVVRRHGRTSPRLIYDRLPAWMTGKRAALDGLVFAYRLDILPDADRWLARDLDTLWTIYRRRETAGTLPPSNIAPLAHARAHAHGQGLDR